MRSDFMSTDSIIKAIKPLVMEAVRSFETSVNMYQTIQWSTPEDSQLHTRHRDKLNSHLATVMGMTCLHVTSYF
jgi:hypothetical protein